MLAPSFRTNEMDRRSFIKLFGAAPTVPLLLKVSKVEAELIKPEVVSESANEIIIANHIPNNLTDQFYNLKDEKVISLSYSNLSDTAEYDFNMRYIPGLMHKIIHCEIYADHNSRLAKVRAGDRLSLGLYYDNSHISHPPLDETVKVICSDINIEACANAFCIAKISFREIV